MASIDAAAFQAAEQILQRAHAQMGMAESHGMLCGMSCSGANPGFEAWVAQVLADAQPSSAVREQCAAVLGAIYRETLSGLYSPELEFQPLLPGEDSGLEVRAQDLGKWCEGFLYGLGLGGIGVPGSMNEDVGEILKDLSEIARLQFEIDVPAEEAEQDFTEVLEYVRTAVLLVSEELRQAPGQTLLQ